LCITFQPKFTKIQVFVTTAKENYNIFIIYKIVLKKYYVNLWTNKLVVCRYDFVSLTEVKQ
jgi:hypothetical protein